MASGYDVLPVVFDRLPLDIQDDPDFLRGLAWDNRDQDSDIIETGSSAKGEVKNWDVLNWFGSLHYLRLHKKESW